MPKIYGCEPYANFKDRISVTNEIRTRFQNNVRTHFDSSYIYYEANVNNALCR
jgi:hypothetical protein